MPDSCNVIEALWEPGYEANRKPKLIFSQPFCYSSHCTICTYNLSQSQKDTMIVHAWSCMHTTSTHFLSDYKSYYIHISKRLYSFFNLCSNGILSNLTHNRSIISILLISWRSPYKLLSRCTPTWHLLSTLLRNLNGDDVTWKRSIDHYNYIPHRIAYLLAPGRILSRCYLLVETVQSPLPSSDLTNTITHTLIN